MTFHNIPPIIYVECVVCMHMYKYICIYILFNYTVITALVNSGLLSHIRSFLFDEYE
jgi:hypothetical protein